MIEQVGCRRQAADHSIFGSDHSKQFYPPGYNVRKGPMIKTLSYYRASAPAAPGLHLFDKGDSVALVRVPRPWTGRILVALYAVVAGFLALLLGMMALLIWRQLAWGLTTQALFAVALTPLTIVFWIVFWLAVCLLGILNIRRHGVVPTVLEATAGGIELRAPGFWGESRRHWPVEEIRSLDVRSLRDVFGRRHVAELHVRIKGRWIDLHIRLNHPDPDFPQRAAAAFRRVLGMEAEEANRV